MIALFFFGWRGFTASRDRELGALGLAQVHHRLLFMLARVPEPSVNALAAALGISRQALHRPLRELLERELVHSRIATHSGRERTLSLTAAGAELELRATSGQREQLASAFAEAGPQAQAGWQQVMRALARQPLAELPPAALELLQQLESDPD